ncbi:MAG: putative solute:sodium symporter small subunit [Rhodocyclaceae bacterium]|nr:putative solute:sodium symporter small subunit [Rhodocyclaceae bacterium]
MPAREEYWRRTRRLTLMLLVVWVLVTYVVSWFARDLNSVVVLGFPLGFYMAAQGSLFVYVAIVWYYCRAMNRLDGEFKVDGN